MIKLLKLFHNNLPIRATKTGGFFSTFLIPLANVSELRYVDEVRTAVKTTFLLKLSEVNSENLTEFRDIDAV